jgi:hypothetical protein
MTIRMPISDKFRSFSKATSGSVFVSLTMSSTVTVELTSERYSFMSLTAISSAAWVDSQIDEWDPVSGRSAPMTISDSDSDAASELEPAKHTKSSSIPITAIAFRVIVMLRCIICYDYKSFSGFCGKIKIAKRTIGTKYFMI